MSKEKIVTPKFLTRKLAEFAVNQVLGMVMKAPFSGLLKRQALHIVILVPSMKDDQENNYPDWPNYQIAPHTLYERSVGKQKDWTAPYKDIARCKALQLWHDRNDNRTDIIPHLLFPGDTPWWGAVKRDGIVVACSAQQQWFDKMISGMTADILIALAYNAWAISNDKEKRLNFLSS